MQQTNPANHTWTPQNDAFILENIGRMSFAQIGAQIGGLSKNAVRGRYLRLRDGKLAGELNNGCAAPSRLQRDPNEPAIRWTGDDNNMVVTVRSDTIRTKDDAIKAANIDLSQWEIERFDIGKHDGFFRSRSWKPDGEDSTEWRRQATVIELWSIKLFLRRKQGISVQEQRDLVISAMKQHAPVYPRLAETFAVPNEERCAYEISLPDLHAGKLTWAPETGASYDTRIAKNAFTDAVVHLIGRVGHLPLEEIWLPLGNDFFNVDNTLNQTTAGTPQDCDDRWKKIFKIMKAAVIETIDMLREIATVRLIIIPGNHDEQKSFYFGDTLESWYAKADNVIVDNAPPFRKKVRYGNNLIGFTHGSDEKTSDLPMLMANEWKKDWAATTWHEWHIGHLHKAKELRFVSGDTYNGVRVRTLPSLSAADAWHYRHGYTGGPRAAEGYLWSYEDGYAGHYSYNYHEPTAAAA